LSPVATDGEFGPVGKLDTQGRIAHTRCRGSLQGARDVVLTKRLLLVGHCDCIELSFGPL